MSTDVAAAVAFGGIDPEMRNEDARTAVVASARLGVRPTTLRCNVGRAAVSGEEEEEEKEGNSRRGEAKERKEYHQHQTRRRQQLQRQQESGVWPWGMLGQCAPSRGQGAVLAVHYARSRAAVEAMVANMSAGLPVCGA